MKRIALLSCVSKKLNGEWKAKDLYISPLFKKSYNYCRKYDFIYILSAEYGFLDENKIVKSYDLTLNNMSKKENIEWSNKVYTEIVKLFKDEEVEFYIHAGENYIKNLVPLLLNHPNFKIINELKGLSIGRRLQFYTEEEKLKKRRLY